MRLKQRREAEIGDTFTIEPGGANLLVPKNGSALVRNADITTAWHSGHFHMDNMLVKNAAIRIKEPTLFVVLPNAKGPAKLEVVP